MAFLSFFPGDSRYSYILACQEKTGNLFLTTDKHWFTQKKEKNRVIAFSFMAIHDAAGPFSTCNRVSIRIY
jgi:hypothetical protein